jgi:hypothetical protein
MKDLLNKNFHFEMKIHSWIKIKKSIFKGGKSFKFDFDKIIYFLYTISQIK